MMTWREWSPRAFAQAAAEQKPVLLSLVTAWSAGCVIMDETTYAHPDVVALIDERFVPIRVDADRHPDVNERYNLGGWPTTAFLTSTGEMLSGGTFLSADEMVGALRQVADAYRHLAHRGVRPQPDTDDAARRVRLQPDPDPRSAVEYFRGLLLDRHDPLHGGFGSAPKLPHASALLFALSMVAESGDADLAHIVDLTLDRIGGLWDPVGGGFFRYADGEDWSRPGTEKTLEDNVALLHVYVEAALTGRTESRTRAADIVGWARTAMADRVNGGFYHANASGGVDEILYIDRNAMMVGALIRAAALFDDPWLRDFALKSLEVVIVPAYVPGDGVAHVACTRSAPAVRGLLTDQIHAASALIWAHAATGQLPYSMLAAELMQFAIRKMWDERTERFRDRVAADDPVTPFELNCHAACVLDRLAILTGDRTYQDRARAIVQSLSPEYRSRDLFGVPYALAVREVLDRRPPAGLELTRVDWQLG